MFSWFKKKRYSGDVVDLVFEYSTKPSQENLYVPSYFYGIYLHQTKTRVGYCDLRVGHNDELYYAGNIGYRISPAYRGNSYAYYACLVLFEIAKEKNLEEIYITCSPDNIPSKITLEKLNGELIGVKDVPKEHWLYQRGETVKNIYHYRLLEQ